MQALFTAALAALCLGPNDMTQGISLHRDPCAIWRDLVDYLAIIWMYLDILFYFTYSNSNKEKKEDKGKAGEEREEEENSLA